MNPPEFRLLHTTAIRLVIKAILLYGLLLSLAFGSLYIINNNRINESVKIEITQKSLLLKNIYATSGLDNLAAHINKQNHEYLYYLQTSHGKKLAGNLAAWPENINIEFNVAAQGAWIEDEVFPIGLQEDDAFLPVVAIKFSDNSKLLIAKNIEQSNYLLELSEFLMEAVGITAIITLLIAIILGRQILNRMNVISASASEIMAGDMSQRIPISNKYDEFDILAQRLNAMLDRIQKLIKGIRDVTDNIAHDLRSPLTRMRSQMEITLLEPRSPEEYQEVLKHSIEDIEALIITFNALLSIAQTEAGNHRAKWEKVNLKTLACDLIDLYTPLAQSNNQSLKLIDDEDLYINGSRDLLAQSLGNLLDNAIKYSGQNGCIKLHIKLIKNKINVIVEDSGPGIPDTEKGRVLEKFIRLESSRNTSGNGLGLSLVAAVAKLHKAELTLENIDSNEDNHEASTSGLKVIQKFIQISE